MEIKLEDIEKIKPYQRNPRKNKPVEKVMESIKQFGFRQPIVVDKKLNIIAGHTRYEASIKLGLKQIPIHIAKELTQEQITAYRIADNRTGEDAQWDFKELNKELGDLLDMNFDISTLGFTDKELEKFLDSVGQGSLTDLSDTVVTLHEVVVECKDEHEQEKIYNQLTEEGKKCRILGLIVGGSGTGKTTIAKEIFKDYYFENFKWTEESIIDNMPKEKTSEEITKVFTSVGLGTVWTWLKPYHVLSNGEMMRVNLARCILENKQQIVFDEFTSVVDRVVAQTASFAISKAVKKMNKKFVAVSCHRDIVDWLEPDWVYDTEEQKFFFAQTNTKDQKLTLKYINAIRKSGNYLRNITI
jgi:ABC-type dipeptide/oligopeptide/nickel transport system ATPase subunit